MRDLYTFALLLLSLSSQAFTVSIVKEDDPCGNGTGYVWAIPAGGEAPYTYLWSNGGTTNVMDGLYGGSYTVDVTDAIGATASASVTIDTPPDLNMDAHITSTDPDCHDDCAGRFRAYLNPTGGQGPFDYAYGPLGGSVTTGSTNGSPFFFPACAQEPMWFTAVDANGCSDSITFVLDPHTTYTAPTTNVTNACAGEANGAVEVDLTGWFFTDAVATGLIGPDNADTIPWGGNFFFDGLAPGGYELRVRPPAYACTEPVYFTIIDQTDCGAVTGTAFVDLDQDCLNGPDDPVLAYRPIVVQPGNIVRLTDAVGGFNIPLDYGAYTLEQAGPDIDQLCPTAAPYPFDLTAGTPVHTVLLADSVTGGIDLSVHVTDSWAIPGFVQTSWIVITNHSGYYPSGAIALSFAHEPIFTFVGSSVTPLSTTAGNVTWALPGLDPLASITIELQLLVPADPSLIGTDYSATATVTSDNDTVTDNNAFQVVGAYDPNDITARTTGGSSSSYFLPTDEDIVYTIRFQNTGNFPAQDIHILDTLSALLDMSRIGIIGASHAFTAAYLEDRTLRFDFPDIQLPDSANDEPNSHGYVAYRIKPVGSLAIGDVVANTAAIYFDLNPAVITNTSLVTVEAAQGILSPATHAVGLVPNPARSVVQVFRNGGPVPVKSAVAIAADGRRMRVEATDLMRGTIGVEHLATGMYLLDLIEVNGTPLRVRMVKE